MTETAHTPLPWRAGDSEIFGADDSVVCTVHWRSGDDRLEANVETIVQAVNSHHRLVEALREAIGAIEDDSGLDDAICCSGHDCGCRGSSHRQLLLHNLTAALKEAGHG